MCPYGNEPSLRFAARSTKLLDMTRKEQIGGPTPKFIRRLLSSAADTELHEATETFDQYMAIVLGIFERVKRCSHETDSPDSETQDKVSSVHL